MLKTGCQQQRRYPRTNLVWTHPDPALSPPARGWGVPRGGCGRARQGATRCVGGRDGAWSLQSERLVNQLRSSCRMACRVALYREGK